MCIRDSIINDKWRFIESAASQKILDEYISCFIHLHIKPNLNGNEMKKVQTKTFIEGVRFFMRGNNQSDRTSSLKLNIHYPRSTNITFGNDTDWNNFLNKVNMERSNKINDCFPAFRTIGISDMTVHTTTTKLYNITRRIQGIEFKDKSLGLLLSDDTPTNGFKTMKLVEDFQTKGDVNFFNFSIKVQINLPLSAANKEYGLFYYKHALRLGNVTIIKISPDENNI